MTIKKKLVKEELTCAGEGGLDNIANLLKSIKDQGLDGAFVEAGVWRGGSCIYARYIMNYLKLEGKVYMCDSFQGCPKPNKKYPFDNSDIHHTYEDLAVSLEEVHKNLKRYKLTEGILAVEGWFEDMLPQLKKEIGDIAILRSDSDLYSSTIQTLENLYDNVVKGGYVIFNNWCNDGVRNAGIAFRKENKINSPIILVDNSPTEFPNYCVAYWQK